MKYRISINRVVKYAGERVYEIEANTPDEAEARLRASLGDCPDFHADPATAGIRIVQDHELALSDDPDEYAVLYVAPENDND